MTLKSDRYTYRITWSPDDQEYVGLCVEFPSLSWLAESPEASLDGIRKIVAEVVQEMNSKGESPPLPLSSKKFLDLEIHSSSERKEIPQKRNS